MKWKIVVNFTSMKETESTKIDKKVLKKVRTLKKKNPSLNIGGFIEQAILEKIERMKAPLPQVPYSHFDNLIK